MNRGCGGRVGVGSGGPVPNACKLTVNANHRVVQMRNAMVYTAQRMQYEVPWYMAKMKACHAKRKKMHKKYSMFMQQQNGREVQGRGRVAGVKCGKGGVAGQAAAGSEG